MADEVKPDPKQATTQDAQLAAENIASGEEKAPTVNMEADYKTAEKFKTASGDTVSQQKGSTDAENQQAGNPENYTAMAKDVAESKDK